MKNLKIKVTLFVAVVLVASLGWVKSQKVAEISDLTLENVEALASGEDSGGWYVYHYTLDNGTPAKNCIRGGDQSC